MSSKQRGSRTGVALAATLLLFGCADTVEDPIAPETASPDIHMSGYVSASLWQPGEQGFTHMGSVRSYAEVTITATEVTTDVGPATVTEPTGSAIETLSIPVSLRASSGPVDLSEVLASARGAGNAVRVDLGGRPFRHEMADGKELRMELSRGKNGRPPRTLAMYLDDELKALNLFTYKRVGTEWAAAALTVVHFANGGVASVTKHDLSEVGEDAVATVPNIGNKTFSRIQDLGSVVCNLVGPTPLHAQTYSPIDGPCTTQQLYFASAATAFMLAEAVYIGALATCAASGGTLCPAVVAAATALTSAGFALAATSRDLDACLSQNSGGTGGDPLPGGGQGCEPVVIEVSDDGGVTWTYHSTVWVCP